MIFELLPKKTSFFLSISQHENIDIWNYMNVGNLLLKIPPHILFTSFLCSYFGGKFKTDTMHELPVFKTKQQIIAFRYTDVFFLFIDQRDTSMYIYIYVIFHHVNHEKNIFFHWIKVKMQFILYNIYIFIISYVCSLKGVHEMTTRYWERGLPVIQYDYHRMLKAKCKRKGLAWQHIIKFHKISSHYLHLFFILNKKI